MKAYLGDGKTASDIPADQMETAKAAHGVLVEAAAEGEDTLLEKYLETGQLSDAEMIRGLRDVIHNGAFIPVFCAAGGHEIGITPLLNAIVDLLPSPVQASARSRRTRRRSDFNSQRMPDLSRRLCGKPPPTRSLAR